MSVCLTDVGEQLVKEHGKKKYYRPQKVNRALGCLWPLRFNVRPKITIFELQRV